MRSSSRCGARPRWRRPTTSSARRGCISDHALIRAVPDSFVDALAAAPAPSLDVAAARRQHAAYAEALAAAGLTVVELAADEAHPDCPFVEDTAVVIGEVALATRPGAPSRRGEVPPVAVALADHMEVVVMKEPATLDGGDVLEIGGTLFVGRSARTNEGGCAVLADLAARQGLDTVTVEFTGALHLKSIVNRLADDAVLLAPGHVAGDPFAGLVQVETPPGEEAAANVLSIGDGTVLVPAGHPGTAARIAAAFLTPVQLVVDEFAKADGGLTCLSLRW